MSKNQADKNTTNQKLPESLSGRLLALDLGEKQTGVAISDELHMAVRAIQSLKSSNWKKLLSSVQELISEFDAKALVIGLPLSLDGQERSAAIKAREVARKFSLSLDVPVYMQDERLTSHEANESLQSAGYRSSEIKSRLDSEAAIVILLDFIANLAGNIEPNPSADKQISMPESK